MIAFFLRCALGASTGAAHDLTSIIMRRLLQQCWVEHPETLASPIVALHVTWAERQLGGAYALMQVSNALCDVQRSGVVWVLWRPFVALPSHAPTISTEAHARAPPVSPPRAIHALVPARTRCSAARCAPRDEDRS